MKTKILTILCLIITCLAHAQKNDSIVKALKAQIGIADSDSVRMPLQLQLANHLYISNIDTSLVIIDAVSEQLENKKYISRYYQKQKGDVLNSYGLISKTKGDLEKTIYYYMQSITIKERIGDSTGLAYAYTNIANSYRRKEAHEKARHYYRKGLQLNELIKDHYNLAKTYISLGISYVQTHQKDSAFYCYRNAKRIDSSSDILERANANIAALYFSNKEYNKAADIYRESIQLFKEQKNYFLVSTCFLNLGVVQTEFKAYDEAITHVDSAISYAKMLGSKDLLSKQYYSRSNINERKGDLHQALADYRIYKRYTDSIHDAETSKRIAELEISNKYEKEKEIAGIQLNNETSKKRLYLVLFMVSILSGLVLIYLIRKTNKQKLRLANNQIELEKVEKLKAGLALATRENELKKVVIESSLKEEVLNKILEQIKQVMLLEDEKERQHSLRSLSATLLSEKTSPKTLSSLQTYFDEISTDFKVQLDSSFPQLKPKEKELLCLMKIGLNTTEISKLQNNSTVAIKSSRYRIRKKLALDSDQDIIAYIDSQSYV